MEKMLTELCAELNNYFWRQKIQGTWTISGGVIIIPQAKEGQCFRIIGSGLNEGVHKYPATNLHDETFTGSVWLMAVPETVTSLASDIEEWLKLYGGVDSQAMSPFNSESFNNYSYSKGTASASASGGGNPNSWQAVFASRLNKYRRMRGLP